MNPDKRSAIVGQPQIHIGFAHGLRQPSLVCALRLQPVDEARSLAWIEALAPELPLAPRPPSRTRAHLQRVLGCIDALLEKAGLPVLERPRIGRSSPPRPDVHVVIHPCLMPQVCLRAVELVLTLLNQAFEDGHTLDAGRGERMRAQIRAWVDQFVKVTPQGFNTLHFLHAAFELDIPFSIVTRNLFQFGWGARSRWLSSSFTDRTPYISTVLARDKSATAEVLRAAGLPVPSHSFAGDAGQAVEVAERLGYPVVVKPADLDGGVGVYANLKTAASVGTAFERAYVHSKQVLVEKHVAGRDYRIQVVGGQVQGVLERVPGGVTGDGVQPVRALLDRQNLDRRTATDDRRHLKEMALDSEAAEMLAEQGLAADSVPLAGQFVRLRTAANVASGGIPVPVAEQSVHADNLLLARRAAAALRLDVAGIDLIISDIGQSWLDAGAAICEVNAQPQMFSTLHKPMLRQLMGEGQGRIPAVVVLGGPAAHDLGASIHHRLNTRGLVAGLACADGVWAGVHCIGRSNRGVHAMGTTLLRDPALEALVLCVGDDGVLRSGWPIDRCDVLVLAGIPLPALRDSALALNPQRVVVDARTAAAWAREGARLPDDHRLHVAGASDDAPAATSTAVVDAVLLSLQWPAQPA